MDLSVEQLLLEHLAPSFRFAVVPDPSGPRPYITYKERHGAFFDARGTLERVRDKRSRPHV